MEVLVSVESIFNRIDVIENKMEDDEFNVLGNGEMERVKYFATFLSSYNWMSTASEKTIDTVFNCAVEIEESFLFEEKAGETLYKMYPDIDFKRSVELLMETFLKSPYLSDSLTLFAVQKFISHYSKDEFCKLLENMSKEILFRGNLTQLIEESVTVDVTSNWDKINSLLNELSLVGDEKGNYKIIDSLKTQASVLLNAVKHGSLMNGQILINNLISVLEAQDDLKLWFILMRSENLATVIDLSVTYDSLLQAILRFFDKFAEEVETNYDEELNLKYSHLNLDFDDFIKVFKQFMDEKSLTKTINHYLECKTNLSDEDFVFWVDVKACI